MITEHEVKERLREALKAAAADAHLLAYVPGQGPIYDAFRKRMAEAEDMCRVLGHYREDSRWFAMGGMMERAHQMTRAWVTIHVARKMYLLLAEKLKDMEKSVRSLETKATGRVGMILPEHDVRG